MFWTMVGAILFVFVGLPLIIYLLYGAGVLTAGVLGNKGCRETIIAILVCIAVVLFLICGGWEWLFGSSPNSSQQLSNCLTKASEDYTYRWNYVCINSGLPNNCSLTLNVANTINNAYSEDKNNCYLLYSK